MNIYQLIEMHEGFRSKPYRCTSGKLTIGIGRNIEDRGITRDEAHYLLCEDVDNVDQELTEALPWYWHLNDARKNALIDLGFNMGVPTLLEFRNTLGLMREKRYDAAASELLRGSGPDGKSLYYSQVGKRAETIAEIIRSGEMPK